LGAIGRTSALACCLVAAQSVHAAEYELLLTEGLTGQDGNDVTFEQRWNEPTIWNLLSGTDDGGDGIPNGTDTFIINRNALANGNTDLSNEGMPDHSIAKITATGAPGRDIVLKQGANVTIGDLEVLASPDTFLIFEERDQPLTINGVLSGPGDLHIQRAGAFSNGVQRVDPNSGEEELITFTGTAPNTYTGNLLLTNSNGNATDPSPAYFVADKVGAFGEAASLTLQSTNANSGPAEIQFTANTIGGEGAIDDDATSVLIGSKGVFNVDAGVNEVIGSGLLSIDLFDTGSPTIVADGTYDNTVDWIIGDGTITVGSVIPALPGDTDGDGDVDDADLGVSFSNYTGPLAPNTGGKTAADGDVDGDGDVDDADLGASFAAYTGPTAPAAVPEPTSLALLGLGGLLAVRRRRA
jgi:hypothetical protein